MTCLDVSVCWDWERLSPEREVVEVGHAYAMIREPVVGVEIILQQRLDGSFLGLVVRIVDLSQLRPMLMLELVEPVLHLFGKNP